MIRNAATLSLALVLCASLACAQNPAARRGLGGMRPPANNERGLRELTDEQIPPNLNFYAMDPLYDPNAKLGWASQRIEEKLDRGMFALSMGEGKVYLGWRLLKTDPEAIAFDVYRSSAGGEPVKLNAEPIRKTTDFIDADAPLDRPNTWRVVPVVGGSELAPSARAELGVDAPAQQYKAIKLKNDVRGVSIVGIGDLNGDGVYDFVVKHPAGGKDPGRVGPNRGSYKYDGYDGATGQFLWRIDLGWNVDMGIWWTPIIVRDLDGDGCDEILAGSIAIDNDGRTLWGTGYGHGDRFHLGDIDPTYPGMECAGGRHFYTAQGRKIDGPVPPQNFLVWWDADPLREILAWRGVSKWKGDSLTDIRGGVQQIADILGDWREEIVTYAEGELRIYSTTIPAEDRRVCLMQDPLYRNDVTHRSMGYAHYPMTSYYLGSK